MNDQILDNELPEDSNKENVRWAGFWIRVGASIIDLLCMLPLVGLSMYNLFYLKILSLQLFITLLLIVYKPFMEFKYGATLGKMAVKIKIVDLSFGKIDAGQAIKRYIPWMIANIISIYGTVLLFQHPDFLNTNDFMATSRLQQEALPQSINYLGSGIQVISCLVVAFTAHKQGLHDMLAGTYCIYNDK